MDHCGRDRTAGCLEGHRVPARRLVIAVALMGLGVLALCDAASADLRMCNDTRSKVWVAIAHAKKDPPGVSTGQHRGVTVEGWWALSPSQCALVSKVDTSRNWVYYYAQADNNEHEWVGSGWLCVRDGARFERGDSFRGSGAKCPARWRLAGFKRIDTDKPNHRVNLKP